MREVLTISVLAKRTGVSSKTLRYWEGLGLLPRPARTHTGYRVFSPQVVERVEFIQKAKSIGLTLAEVSKVLELARSGSNPCPQVARWAEQKMRLLEQQIEFLSSLRRRIERVRRGWSKKLPCPRIEAAEICCLIEDLPTPRLFQGGVHEPKNLVRVNRSAGSHAD